MSLPIRRASMCIISEDQYVDRIRDTLSTMPLTEESIKKAQKIFKDGVANGALSPYGQLSCSYHTYERSIEPYTEARELIQRARTILSELNQKG